MAGYQRSNVVDFTEDMKDEFLKYLDEAGETIKSVSLAMGFNKVYMNNAMSRGRIGKDALASLSLLTDINFLGMLKPNEEETENTFQTCTGKILEKPRIDPAKELAKIAAKKTVGDYIRENHDELKKDFQKFESDLGIEHKENTLPWEDAELFKNVLPKRNKLEDAFREVLKACPDVSITQDGRISISFSVCSDAFEAVMKLPNPDDLLHISKKDICNILLDKYLNTNDQRFLDYIRDINS